MCCKVKIVFTCFHPWHVSLDSALSRLGLRLCKRSDYRRIYSRVIYIYNDPEIVSFCLLHNPNQNGNIFEHPIFIHILANVGRIYIYSIEEEEEEEEEEECMLNKMRLL